MKRVGFLFIIAFYFFTCSHLYADPVSHENQASYDGVTATLNVTVSSDVITIADSVVLNVEVVSPKGFVPHLPSFEEYGFSVNFNERSRRFRATDVSEIDKQSLEDGSVRYSQKFVLEPFLSGNYSILPIMISFDKTDDEPGKNLKKENVDPKDHLAVFSVIAEGFLIDVRRMPENRRELSDIFGQSDYHLDKLTKRERRPEDKSDAELKREEDHKLDEVKALSEKSFPWWIVWAILSAGIIFPIVWFFGRKKISQMINRAPVPAHEIAYKALNDLKEKHLLQHGHIQAFYYELSFILRIYIGNRFQIYAQNQTTEEFFYSLLKSNPFDQESENILREFSNHADEVKYSKYRPDIKKGELSFDIAKSFVDKTRKIEEDVK
ncbi:MAG: hypothetical protein KJ737_10370 [Proteobacteria bacterium]|nr:hypothetical protein [Pseudomonadota bacterium]